MLKHPLNHINRILHQIKKWTNCTFTDLLNIDFNTTTINRHLELINHVISSSKSKYTKELKNAYNSYNTLLENLEIEHTSIIKRMTNQRGFVIKGFDYTNPTKGLDIYELTDDLNDFAQKIFPEVMGVVKALFKIYTDENNINIDDLDQEEDNWKMYAYIKNKIKELKVEK